jgi:hypothetical protein
MTVEIIEITDTSEDKEPIYFAPKRVSLVSVTASIFSWVVLVGFVGDFVVQMINLQATLTAQNLTLSSLLHEPSFYAYIFSNMLIPLFTGLGLFAILQAASVGLEMMLEADYNLRDSKKEEKA